MKNVIVFVFSMVALHMNAQQKIERAYATGSLLIAGQQSSALVFTPANALGVTCGFKGRHSVSAGYSYWWKNEKKQTSGMFGPSYINSEYESFHLLYGRYWHLTPKMCLVLEAGPSYYRILKAYNIHKVYGHNSGWFGGDYSYYEYDTKTLRDVGFLMRLDAVINFWRITGIQVGFDAHISGQVQKFNMRIGHPLGYFQQKKGRIE